MRACWGHARVGLRPWLTRAVADDTAAEIAPLCQKVLSTKLWNEGVKASRLDIPSQYRLEGDSAAQVPGSGSSDSNHTATASRPEQVWGGKPWKTNVVDLEGEVLCSG